MKWNARRGSHGRARRQGRGVPFRRAMLAAGLTWLAGCAADEPARSADEADSRVSVKAVAPTTYRDACEIITAEDVAAIEGVEIEARAEAEPGETHCEYGPPGKWPVMYLVIHWRGGKEEWETWGVGRQLGARIMQDPDVNVDSIIAGDPLSGIGDAAHYGDIMPSLVLVGDVLLEFQMPLLNDPRANFPVLARKAVSRL